MSTISSVLLQLLSSGNHMVVASRVPCQQGLRLQRPRRHSHGHRGAIPPPPPATASRQIPTQSSICCAADLELESVAVDRKPEAASVDREPEAASIDCELEAVAADREPESTVADREPESTVADREPESTVADRSESIKARLLLIKPLAAELRWVGVGRKALRHGVSCCTSHAADENCASAKSSD
nr:hypothetical protein HMPREF0291_10804 [Ipomoea trifida]